MPSLQGASSVESIQHVLLNYPAHEHRKAALRMAVACLPAAHASQLLLYDREVSHLLQDDFKEAAIARRYVFARYHHL